MVPRFPSLTGVPIFGFESGGMIFSIVTSLYKSGRGRGSAISISLEITGIGGFGNRGGVKVGSMAEVDAKYLKFVDNPEDQGTHEICHDPNFVELDLQLYFTAEIEGFGEWPDIVNYVFGFNPITFEYKVVRIYQQEVLDDNTSYYKSEGQVYIIRKGNWRSAGHVIFCFDCRPSGVNLYGKLHWLVFDADRYELICSFDLDNELFELFPTAPGYTVECYRNLRRLGLFGRRLCVCDNNANSHFEV
ncbi:hypothetical protein CQW23_30068 [Capsicum baccatum]|uniref:F-box associated beta-propeller type 3 domain-containing protein n=1 Tax=Capsicum baccatum TaxID=33114 RepID=A0A2G2VBH1_CAPBA|nr:hypothetical protein CQW23_30068 [Capsicum baccatum]